MPICKGAHLKLERADYHISDLAKRIENLKKQLRVSIVIDPGSGRESVKCDFISAEDVDALDRLPILAGDIIHNLKCALDHVWFATVQRLIPSGDWKRTQFPVYPTKKLLEAKLTDLKIDVSSPAFFEFLVRDVKPYDGGDFAVRAVHKLDIRDKHMLLIPMIQSSAIDDIQVEDQFRESYKGFTPSVVDRPPLFVNFESGIHIKDPGNALFDVVFEEGSPESETRIVDIDMFRIYSQSTANIVKLFEKFAES